MTTSGVQALVTKENAGLQSLAAQVDEAHENACASVRAGLDSAREAGSVLLKVKGQLQHGEFLPWVAAHTQLSARTAQGYMRISREWSRLQSAANAKRVSYLPVRTALALLSERAEIHVEDDIVDDERNGWPPEGRAWVELIEGARTAIAEAVQGFSTLADAERDCDTTEAREFMRAVMMGLLNIEAEVARIWVRPTPTRPEVVADEMGIRTKFRDLDAALGDLMREGLEPMEQLRRMRASNRLIEQAGALFVEAQKMTNAEEWSASRVAYQAQLAELETAGTEVL